MNYAFKCRAPPGFEPAAYRGGQIASARARVTLKTAAKNYHELIAH